MKFVYIDGDDIGLKIDNCFISNDEIGLKKINNDVNTAIEDITKFLVKNRYVIIFSGADGIICKNDNIDIDLILNFIRKSINYINFSVGIGNSLRDCFLALRHAKSNGKNIGVLFEDDFKIIK